MIMQQANSINITHPSSYLNALDKLGKLRTASEILARIFNFVKGHVLKIFLE